MPNPNFPNNPGYNLYVGARYVPIFSDVNNGVWDENTAYEPLTIVTYLGDSYTSKTFVPVGIEPTNTTYWANTGNYNAQVEQIRQEIIQVDQELENLSNSTTQSISTLTKDVGDIKSILPSKQRQLYGSKCIVVGDSLAVAGRWSTSFQNASGALCVIAGSGSAGFTRGGNTPPWAGMTFAQMIKQVAGTISPATKVDYDYIVIGGGINDVTQNKTDTELADAALEFINNCRQEFPNAEIHYFFDSTFTVQNNTQYTHTYEKLRNLFTQVFRANGAIVHEDLSFICYDYPEWNNGDNVHMTNNGYVAYGQFIANVVAGGSIGTREIKDIQYHANYTPYISFITTRLGQVNMEIQGTMNGLDVPYTFLAPASSNNLWNFNNSVFKSIFNNRPWAIGMIVTPNLYYQVWTAPLSGTRPLQVDQSAPAIASPTISNNQQFWYSNHFNTAYGVN